MPALAPIALFVHRRPWHARQVLESLAADPLARDSELVVFADGPAPDDPRERREEIAAVRRLLRERPWCGRVEIVESTAQKGLAASIVDGVSAAVRRTGRLIVLEDDIVCGPGLLTFLNTALDAYSDDERVISVSGYVCPTGHPLPETFFVRGADCWGWATWRRGWDLFEPDAAKLLATLEETDTVDVFDYGGAFPYSSALRRQATTISDAWAVRWYASAFVHEKLTLYPGRALVRNIGLDGSGTHGARTAAWEGPLATQAPRVGGIAVQEDAEARAAFARFFRTVRPPPPLPPGPWGRTARWLASLLRRLHVH